MQESNEINFITLSENKLQHMLQAAAHMGAINAMRMAGVAAKDNFTRAEMQRLHGRGKVNRLIESGKLTPSFMDGSSRKYYSESQFQSLLA